MSTDITETVFQCSTGPPPKTQWQFIDLSSKSPGNLTRIKRHVMQEHMRQKRQGASDTQEKKTTRKKKSREPPAQETEQDTASSSKTDETMRKRDRGKTPEPDDAPSRGRLLSPYSSPHRAPRLARQNNLGSHDRGPILWFKDAFPAQVDCSPALRSQLVAAFLDSYLPSVPNPYQRVGGDFTGALPFRLGVSPTLDTAATAMCTAYVGASSQDPVLCREAVAGYGNAVRGLRSRIERCTTSKDIMYAIACLQTYELIQPSQNGMAGWNAHVKGLRAMLQEDTDLSRSGMNDDNYYRHMQIVLVAEAVIRRKSAHVASPVWRPRAPTAFDRILEKLVDCTTLMEELRVLEQGECEDKHTTGERLLRRLVCMESELDAQFDAAQSHMGFPDICNASDSVEHEDGQDADDLFFAEVAFDFPSLSVAQVHSLHWAAKLLTYLSIERLCYLLDISEIPDKPSTYAAESFEPGSGDSQTTRSHRDLIDLAGLAATMICRSVRYCFTPGMNAFGVQVLFVRMWLARQFYHTRPGYEREYDWCQMIVNKISAAGFQGAQDFMMIHWPPPPACQ